MNVTPTDKMFTAMSKMCDHFVGEEPTKVETTPAAERRREDRKAFMDVMHTFVRLSMREGARRFCVERGIRVQEDAIRPDPIAKAVRETLPVGKEVIVG